MTQAAEKIQIHPDTYIEDVCRASVQEVLKETEGRPVEEISFELRRAYPFENGERGGRKYKIWNRVIKEAEARLGIEPRTHTAHKKPQKAAVWDTTPEVSRARTGVLQYQCPTKERLLQLNPVPETPEQAWWFLRNHTDFNEKHKPSHDEVRIVLKGTDGDENDCKNQIRVELTTDDPDERNAAFIKAAQRVHAQWLAMELEKL